MQVERITAGTFTAVVCRPISHAAPGGCVVVYDGADAASAVPCLFLTETTARQLIGLLGAVCTRMSPPAEDDAGGS